MTELEILLIAFGLAMDVFAVSIASGAVLKAPETGKTLRMALVFGTFQFLMPVAGWLAGAGMKAFIVGWAHWLAFGLLAFVGGKMVIEGFRSKAQESAGSSPFDTGNLLILSVATSIDSLAVGISFSAVGVPILRPALVIGLVAFCMSVAGVRIGVKGGHFFENKMEILGGIVLIAIGIKILLVRLLGGG